MESVITGAWDGVKLAVSIASLLIALLGLVALVNLFFGNLAALGQSTNPNLARVGNVFQVITVQNILGALCLPIVSVTGVSDKWPELWQSSILVGRRLLETEVPAYLELAKLSQQGVIGDRALVIVSYILCGFAHIPAVGIFVGGFVSLIPTRRKDLTELGWKALWAASLATAMIGCVAGVFFSGDAAIVGR
jgi:CNT family concentrative nucleoside transporter